MTKRIEEVTDPDNLEWTAEKFARSITFKDLPASLQRTLSKPKRGPQKAPTKVLVSMRLSRDVLAALRATGDGWQVRADEALRQKFAKGSAEDLLLCVNQLVLQPFEMQCSSPVEVVNLRVSGPLICVGSLTGNASLVQNLKVNPFAVGVIWASSSEARSYPAAKCPILP